MSEYGLKITANANAESVNFLDMNFNLRTNIYKPFMKPNDVPLYVHRQSNHPAGILKNIPLSVNKRLSTISSNEDVFKANCRPYQEALVKSGYNFELNYQKQNQKKTKNRRNPRNITYFNPPFSLSVKTKIGDKFLRALDKCFPSYHPLSKIINRNTVKICYRCMPNMKQYITKHNHQVQKDRECPLNGNCLTKEVIYRANVVEEDGSTSTYTGLTGSTFKERFYGHASSFRNRDEGHSTTLSSHIWNLKDAGKKFELKWREKV